MTIPASTRRMPAVSTNGVVTVFAFDFKVFSDADVRVVWEDAFGAQTTLVLGANYTVTINPDQNTSPGGTVTTTSAYPTGLLVVLGDSVYKQGTDIPNSGPFFGDTVEAAIDYAVILIQQLRGAVDRSLKITPVDGAIGELPSATQRANKYLFFDPFGNPTTAAVVTPGALSISPFGETLVQSANAAAATDLLLAGAARRFRADFSNATPASRALFQTSFANSFTVLATIPNGSATETGVQFFNSSAAANCSFGYNYVNSAEVAVSSSRVGSGGFLPLRFYTSNIMRVHVAPNGNVGINNSTPATLLDILGPDNVTAFTGTTWLGLRLRGAQGVTDYSGVDFSTQGQGAPTARIGALFAADGSILQFGTSNNYASGVTNVALTIRADGTLWANNNTRAINGMTRANVVSLAGAASVDIPGIPPWATRVTVETIGASHSNNTARIAVQALVAGVPVATGYQALNMWFGAGGQGGGVTTVRFELLADDGTLATGGVSKFTLTRWPGTNTWVCASGNNVGIVTSGYFSGGHGRVDLAGALNGVRLLTSIGTFTAGQLIVTWE